ncbi:MAG: hypothetical protein ACTSYT_05840 [Candidatus Asgardarchaeia archaeon]
MNYHLMFDHGPACGEAVVDIGSVKERVEQLGCKLIALSMEMFIACLLSDPNLSQNAMMEKWRDTLL